MMTFHEESIAAARASLASAIATHLQHPEVGMTLRYVYDHAVEYFDLFDCFVNMVDGRPSTFEAYATLVECKTLLACLQQATLTPTELEVIRTAFDEIRFTPLCGLVATLVGSLARASLPNVSQAA